MTQFMRGAEHIDQLIYTWTGVYGEGIGNNINRFTRADDPFKTTTTGAHNTVYTTDLVIQMVGDATPYGLFGMSTWPTSGFSTISALPTQSANNGVDKFGGTPEGGNVSDTIKPTIKLINPKPKIMQQAVSMTTTQAALAGTGDNTIVTPEAARAFAIGNFKKRISDAVLEDQSQFAGSGASAAFNYLTNNRFSSLDNLVSNKAEADAVDTHSTNNGWFNSYNAGFNRRTSTDFDSYVGTAGSSLTEYGALAKSDFGDMIYNIKHNSGDIPNVAITSSLVQNAVNKLFDGQLRYLESSTDTLRETTIQFGIAGVSERSGTAGGLKVSSLAGVPIVNVETDMTSSATGDDGRIYALTLNSTNNGGIRPILSISTLTPLTAFALNALGNPGGPDVPGDFNDRMRYVTEGEVVCTKPTAQGKIVNIDL